MTLHRFHRTIVAFDESRPVILDDIRALLFKAMRDETEERFLRETQETGRHAESRDVFHLQGAVRLRDVRNRKRQENAPRMCFPFRFESAVRQNDAAVADFIAVEINRFLIERHEAIDRLSDRRDLMRCDAKRDCRMSALDARREQALAEERVALPRQDIAENFAAGLHALPLLAAHFPNKIGFCLQSLFLLDGKHPQKSVFHENGNTPQPLPRVAYFVFIIPQPPAIVYAKVKSRLIDKSYGNFDEIKNRRHFLLRFFPD